MRRIFQVGIRFGLTALALILQLAVFAILMLRGSEVAPWIGTLSVAVSVGVVAFILNSHMQVEYKLAWAIPIMLMPLFGGAFYLLFGSRTGGHRQTLRYSALQDLAALDLESSVGTVNAIAPSGDAAPALEVASGARIVPSSGSGASRDNDGRSNARPDGGGSDGADPRVAQADADGDAAALDAGDSAAANAQVAVTGPAADEPVATTVHSISAPVDPGAARQIAFLEAIGPFKAYEQTETTYYPVGEAAFADILEALENAQDWIAMEYFIVSDGSMWRQIFDVLVRKSAEGVRIWFMYDDLGSLWKLPDGLVKDLRDAGIRVHAFNRLGPGLTLRYNNRDHRKFTVVDGVVGFTGGINLADEYINAIERFGHWKDTTIRLRGPGAWGMASLFFTIWDLVTGDQTNRAELHPSEERLAGCPGGSGVVLNYDDTPFDDVSVGWAAYRAMMSRANSKIDLTTPYLVPTSEMISELTALAQSGIRVRIVTPGIPDKAYVYAVTRSNYRPLVEAGVELYEYTPGFLHAKQMIVDDETAIIGTINFDFRSFYLHQENAVWMYQTSAIADMSEDFEQIVAKSRRVSVDEVRSTPWWRRAYWLVLRTFSPLM